MEGEISNPKKPQRLEHHLGLGAGMVHGVARLMPRPHERLAAKGIEPRPDEGVPIAHGEAQMLFHRLAEHLLLCIVPAEGKRIAALRPFVFDGLGDRIEVHER